MTVWVTFISWSNDSPNEYDEEQIGYCKVTGKWGISLRRIWGDRSIDSSAEDGPWPFNDAPREMRLRGVDKIPEVIEHLARTTKQIQQKTEETRELAAAIGALAGESKGKTTTLTERVAADQAKSPTIAERIAAGQAHLRDANSITIYEAVIRAKEGSK